MQDFNMTQLNPEKEWRVHRDYLAHCLRWTHVLRYVKKGTTILDVGCGTGNLANVLYKSRMGSWIPLYVGVDVKSNAIKEANKLKLNFPAKFEQLNFCNKVDVDELLDVGGKQSILMKKYFKLIVCFEVLEHMSAKHGRKLLKNLRSVMHKDTTLLLSTPNYDGKHQAANHIYEWKYEELRDELIGNGFTIVKHYGTFASQADLKALFKTNALVWGEDDKASVAIANAEFLFNRLKYYYDSNFLSIIFAPLFPRQSRNILWRLTC